MFLSCFYNYNDKMLKQGIKSLEEAIYNDDYYYMIDIVKYTKGLHLNYIFKTTLLKNKNYKMSLINFACRCNSVKCIKLLIKNNVNINIYDDYGWLPIHYASVYHEQYDNKALNIILSCGDVNLDLKTINGEKVFFNNIKFNTKNKTAFQLANHFLCYG